MDEKVLSPVSGSGDLSGSHVMNSKYSRRAIKRISSDSEILDRDVLLTNQQG